MVSDERGLPATFDLATGKNVAWSAPLGTQSHATPVVAGGRVYIGTNNAVPRDPKQTGDRGVLLCLDEKDGHLLWQLVVPKRTEDKYFDWPDTGMSSPVTVEGDRAYFVDNRGEVLCLDVNGMANGNDGPFLDEAAHAQPFPAPPPDFKPVHAESSAALPPPGPHDADIVWLFDMPAEAGTWPHDGAHSSILIRGDFLYVNTGTGVDNTHRVIRKPDAPSLIVLEKKTGRLVARDDERIGDRIFHATWSSPSFGEVNGKPLIFFAGGDGVVRAFEPLTKSPPAGEVLKLVKVWSFDIDPAAPKDDVHRFTGNRQQGPSDIYGMPVFFKNRIYIAGGGDIWWGKNESWLKCIDATKTGDATSSAELWSAPMDHHVMSTAAVRDGLVFIADTRALRCIDAEKGTEFWKHDLRGEVWASPMIADGRVYIGTRKGDFFIFAASREKQLLADIPGKSPISGTVTAANGTLFLNTQSRIYALREGVQLRSGDSPE
jgi:outer membrane protein assembly factor BamB